MQIHWKQTITAGLIGTLIFDLVGFVLTGEWWDIPGLLGDKLGTGLASGVVAHYANGATLAVIFAAIRPSLWGPRWARATTFITIQTVLGVWLFMLPLLGAGVAGIKLGAMVPVITLLRHWAFGLVLAYGVPTVGRVSDAVDGDVLPAR